MTKELITEKVTNIIIDRLNVDRADVRLDATFKDDLGADSLDTVEFIMELEKEFKIKIHDEQAEKVTTVEEAIDCVYKTINENK